MESIKKEQYNSKTRSLGDALRIEKLFEITVLKTKGTILKKMNISFIVHFCFGKLNFFLNTFSTHYTLFILIFKWHQINNENNNFVVQCLMKSWTNFLDVTDKILTSESIKNGTYQCNTLTVNTVG